jgi:pyruvate, water dikinase
MRVDIHGYRHSGVRPALAPPDPHRAAEPAGTNGFVRWLGDVSGADAPVVGCTGATLGELARAGHPVAPGFVVTVDAYLRALDPLGGRGALRARIADVDPRDRSALTRAARTCQALVRSVEMSAAVQRHVLDAYERLGRDAGHAVAVTVLASPTADDHGSTPSAELDVTFTDVRGGLELVDRIVDCWAARWSPQAVADRAALALRSEPAMAVVVQRMPGSP